MSKKDLACLVAFATGIVLFLYGSNYYSLVSGWFGLAVVAASIVFEVLSEIYSNIGKRDRPPQKS